MSAVQKRKPQIGTLELRRRIVDLAREGHTARAIAPMVGLESHSGVLYHLEAYRAELEPSAELAEEWRTARLSRAAERFRRLGPLALADPPDYQALSALQREEESITKMLGANLEMGVSLAMITAEGMASWLGWAGDEPAAIEGTAVEIPEEAEA